MTLIDATCIIDHIGKGNLNFMLSFLIFTLIESKILETLRSMILRNMEFRLSLNYLFLPHIVFCLILSKVVSNLLLIDTTTDHPGPLLYIPVKHAAAPFITPPKPRGK